MSFASLLKDYFRKGSNILDIGAGSSRLIYELVEEKGAFGTAVDPYINPVSDGKVQKAALKAEELDKLAKKYDMAYTIEAFHHFSAPKIFFSKAKKVLNPGAYLIIIDWIKGAYTGIPERYYDPREVVMLAEAAGFRVNESFAPDADHFCVVLRNEAA